MTTSTVETRIRWLLLVLSIFTFSMTVVELILEEHTDEPLQLLPFFLCGIGIVAAAVVLMRPTRAHFQMMRVVMGVIGVGGVFGVAIHLWRNILFEQDIRPNAALTEVLLNALKGASPLFAPGALTIAAALALLASYYHPAFGRQDGL